MNINDTVFYWTRGFLEEATIFMFGGNEQVLLDNGEEWVLKDVDEVIPMSKMTKIEWQYVNM